MTTRDTSPAGAPCWADLWTSDVDGSRRFYCELFGWEAEDPDPEFGGYFTFTRDGIRIAGGMGDMGADMKANNTWKPYLATEDNAKTLEVAESRGAKVVVPGMPVSDLGIQGVLVDPGGATVGTWQPVTFPGFTIIGEHGAPSWFELHTRGYSRTLEFYTSVFAWETTVASDNEQLRYTTFRSSAGGEDIGGVMDATAWRPEGAPDEWSIYWEVDDCAAAVEKVKRLGGTVLQGPDDTPYGTLVLCVDPTGAQFKLRTSPR
jgi:predicted enzyme related to lactoylglutathione lyase